MLNKKYSVLMSVYIKEEPEFFMKSIQSMINQTLKPDEIIIVKDGPLTEDLENIIIQFEKKYPELFTIIPLKENIGLGKALDVGINHSRNELIARMDTDDISLPERCEQQVKLFNENPKLSIVGAMTDEFYDNPENIISTRRVPTEHEDIFKFMKRRSPFNHPAVMYKKTDVIRSGGYGIMRRKQDLDLFSRMINNGCLAANIDQSLVLFRSNEDSFKRRKSWDYVRSYVKVQYEIWKRGHCSLGDLIYVVIGQLVIFVAPLPMVKALSNKYLRG